MARSPLLSALRRRLTLLRLSQATGEDVSALLQRSKETRARETRAREMPRDLPRRAVLAGTVPLLGACAGLPPAPQRARRGETEVLVVGAGLAGLTCAFRLRQAGVGVRVLEAQDRPGGRVRSLSGPFPHGQVAELGGELVDSGHTALQGLATELGLTLEDLAADGPELSPDTWFAGGALRSDAEVVHAFRPVARALRRSLEGLGEGVEVGWRSGGAAVALDRTPLSAWLEETGADGWMRELLAVAYTAEYGLEADTQSSLNLLTLLEPTEDPFLLFGASDERLHLQGGNEQLPRALAQRLSDALEPGWRLVAVMAASDGRLRCTLEGAGGVRAETARHVVLTLPFTLLRQVELALPLPPLKREAISSLLYGTNTKLMLGVGERIWRTRHRRHGSSVSPAVQLTWETSRAQPGATGILTCFSGGRTGLEGGQGSAAERGRTAVAALEPLFPGVSAAHTGQPAVRAHWPSHPWVRGSYAAYGLGQRTRFGGVEGERVGNLHFAGEHCAGELQGFMEGGVRSGEAAAREVLALLGVRAARLTGS